VPNIAFGGRQPAEFKLGQVDRLRLMVFPQVLGESGQERILQGLPDINLRLGSTQGLDKRLVLLDYYVDLPAASHGDRDP
jgi:hypothetical protein